MVELVYTQHLKCCPERDVGSTPTPSTSNNLFQQMRPRRELHSRIFLLQRNALLLGYVARQKVFYLLFTKFSILIHLKVHLFSGGCVHLHQYKNLSWAQNQKIF